VLLEQLAEMSIATSCGCPLTITMVMHPFRDLASTRAIGGRLLSQVVDIANEKPVSGVKRMLVPIEKFGSDG
jgi:hypothetical protein